MRDITAWNKAAASLGLGLYWVGDANGSNTPDANEVNDIAGIYKDAKGKALTALARDAALVEQLLSGANPKVLTDTQRALLQRESGFRTVELRETYLDAGHFSADERRMVLHILRALHHLEDIYLWQVDPKNLEYKRAVYAQGDALAIRHFVANHGPHCLRVKEPECSALPAHPAIMPGAHLYLTGMSAEEFLKLPATLRSPYAGLEKKNHQTVAVPLADHADLRPVLLAAADELREAARFARVDKKAPKAERQGMAAFKAYLLEVASALLSREVVRPFHKAHQAWVKIPAGFKWALQFGPMEPIGGDPIRGHYGYQAIFGTTSTAPSSPMDVIERYGLQRMENDLAGLAGQKPRVIPDTPSNRVRVVQSMVMTGNIRPPFNSIGGVAEPNDESERLSWVMMNENEESLRRMKRSVTTHFGAKYAHFLEIGQATLNSTIHEQTHKLRVQRIFDVVTPAGAKMTALDALGEKDWSFMEEYKASVAPLWSPTRMTMAGKMTDEMREGLAVAHLSWVFFFLNQPLKNGEGLSVYPVVALMILGQLIEKGTLQWNAALGIWDVQLDDMEEAGEKLKDVMTIQANGDRAGAEVIVNRYVQDQKLLKIRERIQERSKAAGMPPPMTYVYAVGMDE